MADKIRTPKHGWRMAWRQSYPNRSNLFHRHSTTVYPAEERDELLRIIEVRNAGFKLENGEPGLVHWLEWYDEAIDPDDKCHGTYWEEKREKRDAR